MTVLVIRTPEVARTVEFLTGLGLTFVEEQHGDGPVHYACEVDGNVLEVYPGEGGATARFLTGD
jgi:lactoylglutathione lyase